jgi:hypothetical protein
MARDKRADGFKPDSFSWTDDEGSRGGALDEELQ